MPSGHFRADLRSARSQLEEQGLPGLVSIERGDSDGEFVATFAHDNLANPIPVRLLAQRLDEYPHENSFLLFTDVEDAPSTVMRTLEDFQVHTFGQTILQSILGLSSALDRTLNRTDSDGDISMDAGEEDGEDEDEDEDEDDVFDDAMFDNYEDEDEVFGLSSKPTTNSLGNGPPTASVVLKKIKQDLRQARDAGAKVGILSGVSHPASLHTVSLSIRANKLGISCETLEAWDLEPSDHVVLLIRMNEPYPSAENLSTSSLNVFHTVDFRLGKCRRYKPALASVQAAFNNVEPQQFATTEAAKSVEPSDGDFHRLFISKSLDQFMNESFLSLFKLRLKGCPTWEEAHIQLEDLAVVFQEEVLTSPRKAAESEEDRKSEGMSKGKGKGKEAAADSTATDHDSAPEILLRDSFALPVQAMSTPLVAMQFAIHNFARCTEYCLRCHRKLDKEFEALKPFVCQDPLCLFQYITMGLGPSVEHEIVTQPYVVDLLVSLCYSSIQNPWQVGGIPVVVKRNNLQKYAIRDFPTGLRLKTPHRMASDDGDDGGCHDDGIEVYVVFSDGRITVETNKDLDRISADTWVVLQHSEPVGSSMPFVHQAHVKSVDRSNRSILVDFRYRDPNLLIRKPPQGYKMSLYNYDQEFDDLNDEGKAATMVTILNTLPPVSRMREYLIRKPHSTLKSCPGVSRHALTLLNWIVASNRSCIFQVGKVDDSHAKDLDLLSTIKTREQEIIPSMGPYYIQFRFAQGTPDKEFRFQRALEELEARGQTSYPTLFAWHGSALGNWHSIMRQGLDFNNVINGRAYGHGVYFSSEFNTSRGYMAASTSWPNSALDACGVIALCEIINSPAQFVSSTPHYVVQQLDWIQCRYLMVAKRSDSATAMDDWASGEVNQDQPNYVAQDPLRPVKGPRVSNVLNIPLSALPSSRSAQQASGASKRPLAALEASSEPDEEDISDLEALSTVEVVQPPMKRRLIARSRALSMDADTAHQATTHRPPTPPMTDFTPGSLDLRSLPRLALPQWADAKSTKRLTNDIKQLQTVYATTPLHELGWYIDFDNIENMFQWIVELHSFNPELPLAKDMKAAGVRSVILEVRFGRDYPMSPPFVRVIRPRFLPFMSGGGGHVTIGGALCMELLTSNGWSPATSMEAVFVCIKLAMSSTDPRPARLESAVMGSGSSAGALKDYPAMAALVAFERAARTHGWTVPQDVHANASQAYE